MDNTFKEELRKEFDEKFCFTTMLGNITMKEIDIEKYWEWFLSKLEEKQKEIEEWKTVVKVNNEKAQTEIERLQSLLQKADEVIDKMDTFLAFEEDSAHGDYGKRITELRGEIQTIVLSGQNRCLCNKKTIEDCLNDCLNFNNTTAKKENKT